MNDIVIALDTDWVSDPVIAKVVGYLLDRKVKSTWFITHDSPQIRRLFDYPDLVEVGIHPNFDECSTQGKTRREVMRYLLKIVPNAKSVRTHGLMQSTPILGLMREFQILYDTSLFLPHQPDIVPHELFLPEGLSILRFPFFWEDDLEMHRPNPCFSTHQTDVSGLKIFVFHPIHIALNSYSMENYELLKSRLKLIECSLSDLRDYANQSECGAGVFFEDLVQLVKARAHGGLTISDLASKWRSIQ